MTNNIPKDPALKAEFSNNLFLIFKDGFEFTHSLFDTLDEKEQILITKKLEELNQIIANFEKRNLECGKNPQK